MLKSEQPTFEKLDNQMTEHSEIADQQIDDQGLLAWPSADKGISQRKRGCTSYSL